jgi:PAS domain S-box-containing protein
MENTLGTNTIQADDHQRVEVLKSFNILHTPPEKSFNNIAKLSAQFFDLPIAFISFVDTDHIFIKAAVGLGTTVNNTPRTESLCTVAILNDKITVIDDFEHIDPCLGADPVFIAELGFKFYAAAPITTPDGFRIGTVTVVGFEPRKFSEKDALILEHMATIVMDEIVLRVKGIKEAEQNLLDAVDQAKRNFSSKSLLAEAPVAIAVLSGRELAIQVANHKILEVWGKTDEIIGKPLKVALPELKTQPFLKILDDVFTTGIPFYGKELSAYLFRNNVLEEVFFNFVYQPMKDSSGQTVNIMIVATDITDEIKARKLLESTGRQLEGMVMNSTAGMGILTGRDLIIEVANQSLCDIWEVSREQVIGKSIFDLFPGREDNLFPSSLLRIFDTHEEISSFENEVEFATVDGIKKIFINTKYVPLLDDDGNVEHIIVTATDTTEIVRTRKFFSQIEGFYQRSNKLLMQTLMDLIAANEVVPGEDVPNLNSKIKENLKQAEDNLRNAIETTNLGTWFIDVKTMHLESTAGLKRLFGFYADDEMSFDDAVGQMDIKYRDAVMAAMDATMMSGEPYHIEYEVTGYRDQKVRWLTAYGKLTRDSDGQPSFFSGVAFDITEQKNAVD